MSHRRFRTVCATAAAGAIALAGCSGGGETVGGGGGGGSATGEVQQGGTVHAVVLQAVRFLDPALIQTGNWGALGAYMQALYDLLFYVDPKSNKVQGLIGESIEPDAACTTWTIKLKPDVKFTDGTTLDAEAVRFNWKRLQDPATKAPTGRNLKGVTFAVKDPTTLEVKLPEANCAFDRVVAYNLPYIASPAAIKKYGADYTSHPVGAGPFKLESWNKASNTVTMVRNDDYFGEKAKLDKLIVSQAGNQATILDSIAGGQLQLAGAVSVPRAADTAKEQGLGLTILEQGGGAAYQFNTAKPPFKELCARQAFAYALDPEGINTAMNESELTGGATKGLFPEGSPYYDASITFPSNDQAKMKAALDECKSKNNPLTFSIEAIAGTQDVKQAEYVSTRLNAIDGFKVNVVPVAPAEAAQKIFINHDFNVTSYPGGMRFGDPDPLWRNWLRSDGTINLPGYKSPEMDAAMKKAASTRDEAGRVAAYKDVQKVWVKDIPYWVHQKPVAFFVYDKKLTGMTIVNPGFDLLLNQDLALTK